MAAPTSTNNVTSRKLASTITSLWGKIKDTFQTKLGISSSGDSTKFLNEKGEWVVPAGASAGSIEEIGATAVDLNNLTATDSKVHYYAWSNSNRENVSNKPSDAVYTVCVFVQGSGSLGTYVMQMAYKRGTSEIYVRCRSDGSTTWSSWEMLASSTGTYSQMTVGNATNATNATTASAVSTEGVGTSDAARHVWFSDSATESKRVYNDNFKYNPSGNIVTANISGNAATASDAAAVGPYSAFASTAVAFGFSRLGTVIFSSSAKKGLMTFRVHASRDIKDVYILNGEFGRNDRGGVTARFTTQGPGDPAYKLYYKDVSDSTNPKYEIWFVDVANTGSLERRVRIELISIDISGFDRNFTSQQTNPGSLTAFLRSTFDAYINWKFIDYEIMTWNSTSNRVYQSIGYSAARGAGGTTTTLLISNGDSGGVQGTYLVRFLYRETPIVQYKQLFGVTTSRDIMEFGYYISGDYAYLTVYKSKWASRRPIHVISLDDNFVFARGSETTSAPSGYVAGTEQGFSSLADKGDGDGNNRVFAHWTGNNVTSVTPSSSQARTGTKWLVAGYTESDGTHFNVVDVNNVTVKNAQQINGYPVIVGQLGTATGTIYFV